MRKVRTEVTCRHSSNKLSWIATFRLYPWLGLALLLTACTPTPVLEEQPSSRYPGLNVVSGSGFKEAWARPGAGLKDYDSVVASPLESADAEIRQPPSSATGRQDWQLTPESEQALAEMWDNAISKAASERGLRAGSEGTSVLRIDASLTRIAPSANRQQEQKTPGRSTVYTEDAGEAAIEIRLYDHESGELLVVIHDKRRIGVQSWGRASSVTASADARNLFNRWANQLLSRITGT